MMRNLALTDGFGKRDEDRMTRRGCGWIGEVRVAIIEFLLPEIDERQRQPDIANFIAEVVGDTAVGVDAEEMLVQTFGQKPSRYGEVLVVAARESLAISSGFFEAGSDFRNLVFGG
jgi:hypothetical protein